MAQTKKQRGRPEGPKSKDPDFAQTTVYIKRDLYGAVRGRLISEQNDFSSLVNTLLAEWFKKPKP